MMRGSGIVLAICALLVVVVAAGTPSLSLQAQIWMCVHSDVRVWNASWETTEGPPQIRHLPSSRPRLTDPMTPTSNTDSEAGNAGDELEQVRVDTCERTS